MIVTDAMVDAALAEWYPGEWPDDPTFDVIIPTTPPEPYRNQAKRDMRAAIKAALAARPQPS
jgi:hypothetical protein